MTDKIEGQVRFRLYDTAKKLELSQEELEPAVLDWLAEVFGG